MAEVVVIGASLPGLAAATWLAQAGVDVALLDRRVDLADTAFARGPGVLHGGLPEQAWRLVSSLGADQAGVLHRFGAEGLELLSTLAPVNPCGTVWAAAESEREPGELARSVDALQAMGLPAELGDGARVDAEVGSVGFHGGMWRPDEGTCVPIDVVAALLTGARAAGVVVHLGARVTDVRAHDGAFEVVAGAITVPAEIVIYAGEADAIGLDSFYDDCLFPVREQALALRRATPLPLGLRAAFGWTQAWTRPDGALALAGCRWASDHMEEGETDDHTLNEHVQAKLEGFAHRYFPDAGEVIERWAWIQAHTCDGLPLVGPLPGDPRRVSLVGFGGCEAGLGVRSARAVVDGILHGHADGVPTGFAPSRLIA